MCAEKIQRSLMASVLLLSMWLITEGLTSYGLALQGFIVFMIIVWAVKDFCPSLWAFDKLFGSCAKK